MKARPGSTLWRTQNFIRSLALVEHLIDLSDIGADDVVYEIGAGTGNLTDRLSARSRRVVAIERDETLCAGLRTRFEGRTNVAVRCADFLEYPLPRAPYKVFANPPFDITTAIITNLTSAPTPPIEAYLAVQREAADRYLGQPSQTLYALLLSPWFALSVVHRFKRTDFTPRPGVDVVMLRLSKRDPPLVAPKHRSGYRDLMVTCFTGWYPSIGAGLAKAIGPRSADLALRTAGIRASARPRSVTSRDWLRLFDAVIAMGVPLTRVADAEARLRRQQARLRRGHRTRVTGPPERDRVVRVRALQTVDDSFALAAISITARRSEMRVPVQTGASRPGHSPGAVKSTARMPAWIAPTSSPPSPFPTYRQSLAAIARRSHATR